MNALNPLKIVEVQRLNEPNRFLNLYEAIWSKNGKSGKYFLASRKNTPMVRSENRTIIPDAVVCAATNCGGPKPLLIMTLEFRLPINAYELGFVAGLIEVGETPEQSAARELKEEANQEIIHILSKSPPLISSAGMGDESFTMIECFTKGELTSVNQEGTEDIHVFGLDFDQIKEVYEGRGPLSPYPMSGRAWPVLNKIVERGYLQRA